MRYLAITLCSLFLIACSQGEVEEFAFRKAIEYDLIEMCDKEQECITAVESQIKDCMENSKWRSYLENQDDEAELKRFSTEFYACIVDSEGNPYFESSL